MPPTLKLQANWRSLDKVVLTQGFIAANAAGDTVLLGRGGSDTSAAYFAAKLGAARLEIWTDVPGLFSANPRAVPTARLLRELHYDEAQEIASNGAKVLHPRCVLPVRQYKIPLHVYATQAPGLEGTVVTANVADTAAQVKAIAIKRESRWFRWKVPACGIKSAFWPTPSRYSSSTVCRSIWCRHRKPMSPYLWIPRANTLDGAALDGLAAALSEICRVEILGPAPR